MITRSSNKKYGDVFTSSDLVCYMLDLVGYKAECNLSNLSILEPSCGEGAFVVEIVKRLKQSSSRYKFDFREASQRNLLFYDTDIEKILKCKKKLESVNLEIEDSIFKVEDFLLSSQLNVDIVVGNPPYVRHERIGYDDKVLYKQKFSTFNHKADLYIPFFEKSLSSLNIDGKHCFVCSNRWFKSQYGVGLRGLISYQYCLEKIINIEHTNPFDDAVIAYPSITLITNSINNSKEVEYTCINDLRDLRCAKSYKKESVHGVDWSSIFGNRQEYDGLYTIKELGFNIGIGVATGADDIFVRSDLNSHIEESLLLPIINTRDITKEGIKWSGNYLFNPFDSEGNVINISEYPLAERYLNRHKERLQSRYISRKNPKNWYRTIDRVSVETMKSPKIILPDITSNRFIQIDNGEYYPHHNLYYISDSCINKLKVLGAVLMTDFVYNQLLSLSNLMNGGYPRWQSQYLKKIKFPNILEWSSELRNKMIEMYDNKDIAGINSLMKQILN